MGSQWKTINANYKNMEGYKRVEWPPKSEERIVREFTPQPTNSIPYPVSGSGSGNESATGVAPTQAPYYNQQQYEQPSQSFEEYATPYNYPSRNVNVIPTSTPPKRWRPIQPSVAKTQREYCANIAKSTWPQQQYRAASFDNYQQQPTYATTYEQRPWNQQQQQQQQPAAYYQQQQPQRSSQPPAYYAQPQQQQQQYQYPIDNQNNQSPYNSYSQFQQQHQQPRNIPIQLSQDQVDYQQQQLQQQQQQQQLQQQRAVSLSHDYRGGSPGVIQLRKEAPISQRPAPVYTSQPAAVSFQGGSNMRGDLKWPPQEYKEAAARENEERRKIAMGPVCRPRKVHRDYTNFFAKNQINNYYPSYKVPPGTQHMFA